MAITKASLIDLNGQELILDADADTSITADTDDILDFKTGGTDRLKISGNNLHLNGGTDARIQLGSGGAGANSTSNDTVHIRGDGDDMKLMTAADGNYIFENNGTEYFRIAAGQIDVKSADLKMQDSRSLYLGAGNDLRIYHDGSDSYIKDQGTGNLVISSSDTYFTDMTTVRWVFDDATVQIADGGTNAAVIKVGAGDEMYYASDNADGYLQMKTDGNSKMVSPANFWVNIGGSDRYGMDSAQLYPASDNHYSLGHSSYRWHTVYRVNESSSSDARKKTTLTALTDNEIKASKLLAKEIGTYKWLKDVSEKGDKAKINVGLTAQKVVEIMNSCSLNALDYQMVQYYEWDAEEAKTGTRLKTDEKGDTKVEEYEEKTAREAGNEYAVSYEQINQFIAAGFNARLTALEDA